MKTLLIIGHTFPEPTTTAAGTRMMQLISLFEKENYKIVFSSTASITEKSETFKCAPVEVKSIALNNTSFDDFIKNHPKDRALVFCNEHIESNESMFSSIMAERSKYNKWTLLIGPEGGFSQDECNRIVKLTNVISVSLGKRILRSDTATVAALFCLQSIIDRND